MIILRTKDYFNPEVYGVEEQREFGWITSKIVRPAKVYIGKARRSMADSLYDAGTYRVLKSQWAVNEMFNNPTSAVINKDLRNRILKNETPRLKTTVVFGPTGTTKGQNSYVLPKRSAGDAINKGSLRSPFENDKKKGLVKKIVKKGDRLSGVYVDGGAGVEVLAHELGHAEGLAGGGSKLRQRISNADPRLGRASNYSGSVNMYKKKYIPKPLFGLKAQPAVTGTERVGFKTALKDYVNNVKAGRAIVKEENAASRGGLNIMRRNGATKDELKAARNNLKICGDTYRAVANHANKSALGRLIDIPSRRASGIAVL